MGHDATLVTRNGITEFCSFPESQYVYRFIVKKSRNMFDAIKHVEIGRKGSARSAVIRYDLIGLDNTLDPGQQGTTYRVFERAQADHSMPRYFYHASHPRYTRTAHFFTNRIAMAQGPVEVIERAVFSAEIYPYGDVFICGYDD
jgi:hypothetical protein